MKIIAYEGNEHDEIVKTIEMVFEVIPEIRVTKFIISDIETEAKQSDLDDASKSVKKWLYKLNNSPLFSAKGTVLWRLEGKFTDEEKFSIKKQYLMEDV